MKLPGVPHARVNLQLHVNSGFAGRTFDTNRVLPQNLVVEATSPEGANVNYQQAAAGGMSPSNVLNYSLHGTLSQSILGRDPFGRSIRQNGTPTDLQGRERIAVKNVGPKGLSLHRSGSIQATFRNGCSTLQRHWASSALNWIGPSQRRCWALPERHGHWPIS